MHNLFNNCGLAQNPYQLKGVAHSPRACFPLHSLQCIQPYTRGGGAVQSVKRPKRCSSDCALLVRVFDRQMSYMIPGVGDTREAKMTGACSP